ncbi:unnamed protein product [Polarella glacialis]|uniref:Uncharacterized protein n=1 Tax=Polarella glacialis TaxID=89957 RepID=A0A813L138_POLGL|nr:unnamed protein product [Polarella glacialis]
MALHALQEVDSRGGGAQDEFDATRPQELEMTAQDTGFAANMGRPVSEASDLHEECDERFQPFRPNWQQWRNQDPRPVDRTMVEVPSGDRLVKTKNGLARISSGLVRFSVVQGIKFRNDAEALLFLIRQGLPATSRAWSLQSLEKAFQMKVRIGSWSRYSVPFDAYLSLFPRTFELFGSDRQFVRALHMSATCVVDSIEDVMMRLAMARHHGYVEQQTPIDGTARTPCVRTPQISTSCAKAMYLPSPGPSAPVF